MQVFVLHDFDLAGFKILKTLEEGTRLAPGSNPVDIGLRIEDIEDMDLESEPLTYRQTKDPREYLIACGATREEYNFLVEEQHYRQRNSCPCCR